MSNLVPFKMLSAVTVLDSTLDGWTLLEGDGELPRSYRRAVTFEQPFGIGPLVQVGLVGLDVSKDDNLRVRVRALDVTPDGFTVHVETWFNTRIWLVEVSWLAIGS